MDAIVRQRDRQQALTPDDHRPTIFARSTGALPAAIAIVRISGSQAGKALRTLSARTLPTPRTAALRKLYDPVTRGLLDDALVLWMPGPATVTGDDLVELHLHGGRAVVIAVERALSAIAGLQPAEAGAFTRRAFTNGKLDLTQVEGLADLLAAETERQRTAALIVAEGGLRREVESWQATLLSLAARAEAQIDFADEGDVGAQDHRLRCDIRLLADTFEAALANPPVERLRDGVRVTIAGPPNAGKSTLLNALVGRDAAIASPIAGTTRDLIETAVNLSGIPIVFVDTAGLHGRSVDPVEAIGIERAEAAIARSDIVLWLGDSNFAPSGTHVICVGAKSDLAPCADDVDVHVSALTGDGMPALLTIIGEHAALLLPAVGGLSLSSAQLASVRSAADAARRAADQADEVLRAEDLRSVMRALDRITGAADTEAMLDALFGRFCIGK